MLTGHGSSLMISMNSYGLVMTFAPFPERLANTIMAYCRPRYSNKLPIKFLNSGNKV
jgi:hypothetical protein